MAERTRRRYLQLVGAGTLVGAAGCLDVTNGGDSNDDDDDDDETGDPGGSPTDGGTPTPVREARGSVGENETSGLAFVGWTSHVDADRDLFDVTFTVRNVGEETTDVFNYYIGATVYDENGNELESNSYSNRADVTEIGPGDATTVQTGRTLDDPDAVASYTISLYCTPDSEAVYCGN